jgi:type II secretory pathway component GspD/PulD (secretin)
MRVAGLLGSEREVRMVTLDGQPVTAQIGRNQPRIVATASDPRAGRVNSLKMEQIGVMIKAVPQIDSEEQIQVSLEVSESGLEKSTDVVMTMPAEGNPLFADVVTTRQFNTTARVKSGSAVLVQHDAAHDSDDPSRDMTELIILGAAVVEARD